MCCQEDAIIELRYGKLRNMPEMQLKVKGKRRIHGSL